MGIFHAMTAETTTDAQDRAARLRAAREHAGFSSAREAALNFGFSDATYGQHENGTRGIRGPVAERYAAAFGVSASWIMYGDGPGPGEERRAPRAKAAGGMAEADVQPLLGASSAQSVMLRRIARAILPNDENPAFYICARTRHDLLLARGDTLILALDGKIAEGDIAVVQLFDRAGEAETQLRQVVAGHYLGDRDAAERLIACDDPTVALRGRVVGSVRQNGQ